MIRAVLISIPLIFASCGFQNFDGVRTNNLNERIFENSAIGRVLDREREVKADIKAIYMSDISSKFRDYDVFLVSIYFFDSDIDGLKDINYSFQLNGVKPIKIDRISKDSRVISQVKLLNPWFKNYIVYFKKLESEDLSFSFRYGNLENLSLSFTKGVGQKRDYPAIADKLYTLPKLD